MQSTDSDTHPLEVVDVSGEKETSLDRWRQRFDDWVVAPSYIIWEDMRTRVGMAIIMFYLFMGTGGVIILDPPEQGEGQRFLSPFVNMEHPLGTDILGNDLLESIVHATPAMWKMIFAGAVLTTGLGTAIGIISGYKRGRIDTVLMTFTDIVMTIPGLPLLIVLAVALEPENPFVIGAFLSVNAWAGLARSIRSQVLSLRQESYVEASRAMDIGTPKILTYDILPNIMPYVMINFVGSANRVIYSAVGLYFLGVLPFTTLNWGVMMNLAYQNGALLSFQAVHWMILPLVTITMLSYGLVLFAQGMDRLFNPRVRARHSSHKSDEQSVQDEPSTDGEIVT
jgi:peptide/nickel transport system permease protein